MDTDCKADIRSHLPCRGHGGELLVGVLPVALFANGHTFFISNLGETLGLQPIAAHNNLHFSGTHGKRHRFRETGLWIRVSEALLAAPNTGFDISYAQSVADIVGWHS